MQLLHERETSHEGEGRLPVLLLETGTSSTHPPIGGRVASKREQGRKESTHETTTGATNCGGDGARGAGA